MKSRKTRLFSSLLACILILLLFSFIGTNPRAETQTTDSDPAENTVLIGEDSESYYNLCIGLKVFFNSDEDEYKVTATAEWHKAGIFTKSKKCARSSYLDYIVISWGGDGALRAQSENIYGEYRNGKNVAFSIRTGDAHSGYTWQFAEMSRRSQMSFANVTFNLKSIKEDIGRETSVKMTYVHTYSILKPTVPIIFGEGLSLDKITYKKSEEKWQIAIAVADIKY